MSKPRKRRKADRTGLEGIEGKFERLDFDLQQKIKVNVKQVPDKKELTEDLREDFLQILDQFEETLTQTYFDSEQVDFYYRQLKKQQEQSSTASIIFKIILSLVLFSFSLFIVAVDCREKGKGLCCSI